MRRDDATEQVRPIVEDLARQARDGTLPRREFLALASTFGASSAAAYGLLGLTAPAAKADGSPKRGGTLRVGSRVIEITDPRKFAKTEQGNLARTFCEPLVRWEYDATFAPVPKAEIDAALDALGDRGLSRVRVEPDTPFAAALIERGLARPAAYRGNTLY